MKIYPENPAYQLKGLPMLLLCSRVAPNNNMMEALMKATSYELRQRAIMSDHFDTSSTLTNVKVPSNGRVIPQKLTRREFEHLDTVRGEITVKVPTNLHGTLTDFKADQKAEKSPQIHICKGNTHYNGQKTRLCVKVLPSSDPAKRRLIQGTQIDDEFDSTSGKLEFAAASDQAAFIDFTPRDNLPYKHNREARLLGHFCTVVFRRLATCHSKVEEWKLIVEEYNNGSMVPELFRLRGERKERALRLWIDQYIKSNQDMFALLHKGKNVSHQRKVTDIESKVLLSILMHPNQITIGSAINMLKAQARLGYYESPTSKPTLRRWCNEWRDDHLAAWEQTRKGSKYVAEHIVKSIHRDARLLRVGQVWVADGHTLAFDILNPQTGKAQRMTVIMVFDWASRYPVGASLAFTEDSQHIQAAFRNAFLNTSQWYLQTDAEGNTVQTRPPFAFVPEAVYLDNGKAFRSKLFHESWEGHDLEVELGGVFPKLGIEAHFAESYTAKAKVIERFFRTFQEQFERFISSFRGANVANKPSTLMRNEKWAKALYKSEPPTIEEAMRMIGFYIRYIYGENEHGGLEGKKPWEVYSSALIPEERMLRPDKLNFMMLTTERKSVRNEGIVFNKLLYWHIALMDNIGKPVIIRYDYADARWILVYDTKDKFICQAELRRSQHPFIHIDKDNPVSHQSLKKEYTQIKKLQRLTEQHARDFVLHNQESVDKLLAPYVEASLTAPNPTFKQGNMIAAPEPDAQDRIEEMEQELVKDLPELEFISPEEQNFGANQTDTKITDTQNEKKTSTADPEPEEQDDDDDESFYGMLKKVGII